MNISQLIKPIVRHLRGRSFFYPEHQLFQELSRSYRLAAALLRGFYIFSLVMTAHSFHWFLNKYTASSYVAPLWPFYLLSETDLQMFVPWVLWGIIVACTGCIARPDVRVFRVFHAAAVFFLVTIINSNGHFAHSFHVYMWVSLLLVFLPKKPSGRGAVPREYKFRFLLSFWFIQLMVGLFYVLSGVWKVEGIVTCALSPHYTCELSHKILTNISAQEAISYYKFAPYRKLFFDYPWVAFFGYIGTIWIHLVSLYFVFRPDCHRLFGFLRLIFHIGTFLFFGVNFSMMSVFICWLFLASPFDRTQSYKEVLKRFFSLPPFNLLFSKLARHKSYRLNAKMDDWPWSVLALFYSFQAAVASDTSGWAWGVVSNNKWRFSHFLDLADLAPTHEVYSYVIFTSWLLVTFTTALFPQYKTLRLILWLIVSLVGFHWVGATYLAYATSLSLFAMVWFDEWWSLVVRFQWNSSWLYVALVLISVLSVNSWGQGFIVTSSWLTGSMMLLAMILGLRPSDSQA